MFWWFVAATSLALPANVAFPEVTFSADPSFSPVKTEVTAGFLDHKGGVTHYWFRRVLIDRSKRVVKAQLTDTRACPASREILVSLGRLDGARPIVWGLDGSNDISVVADGVSYELTARAAPPYGGGEVRMRSNVNTPLAKWVSASFATLDGCSGPLTKT